MATSVPSSSMASRTNGQNNATGSTVHDAPDDLLALLVQIHLEDIGHISRQQQHKGKARQDLSDDSDIAFELYAEQLRLVQQCLTDREIAVSMGAGDLAQYNSNDEVSHVRPVRDEPIPREAATLIASEDSDAQVDWQLRPLSPVSPSTAAAASSSLLHTPSRRDDPARPKPFTLSIVIDSDDSGTEVASRSSAPLSPPTIAVSPSPVSPATSLEMPACGSDANTVECVICSSPVSKDEAVSVSCGHYFDPHCLADLFVEATKDETLMPAQCCKQPVPLYLARLYLTNDQVLEYTGKEAEHFTPKSKILYCPNATCSTLLVTGNYKADTSGIIVCNKCSQRICTQCKGSEHPLGVCKPDSTDDNFLELAKREGYQRCKSCGQVTELLYGCYHITCKCGGQFCYLCGAAWKTCGCPQAEERHL